MLAVYGTMSILPVFLYIIHPIFVAAKFHNLLILCAFVVSQKCLLASSYLRPFARPSVRPSVSPQVSTRLPLNGFSRDLIFGTP